MSGAHPNCWNGDDRDHTSCRVPSGRLCIEDGCDFEAGTLWSPHWCPSHDVERLDRIDAGLRVMKRRLTGEAGSCV